MLLDLPQLGLAPLHLFNLVSQLVGVGPVRGVLFLFIGLIQLFEVVVDLLIEVLQLPLKLLLGEVATFAILGLELAAVDILPMFLRDRHQLAAEEAELAAEEGELAAPLADSCSIVAAEVGDGLKVGGEALEEPHEFQVAAGFALEQATRSKAVEVAVDLELEQVGGVVGRSAGLLEDRMFEAQGR